MGVITSSDKLRREYHVRITQNKEGTALQDLKDLRKLLKRALDPDTWGSGDYNKEYDQKLRQELNTLKKIIKLTESLGEI